MLQDVFLTKEEIALKQEVRDFVKNEVTADFVKKWIATRLRTPGNM